MLEVAQALRARHPQLPVELVTDTRQAAIRQNPAGSPLIRCGDEFVVVMSMPAPIPQDAALAGMVGAEPAFGGDPAGGPKGGGGGIFSMGETPYNAFSDDYSSNPGDDGG